MFLCYILLTNISHITYSTSFLPLDIDITSVNFKIAYVVHYFPTVWFHLSVLVIQMQLEINNWHLLVDFWLAAIGSFRLVTQTTCTEFSFPQQFFHWKICYGAKSSHVVRFAAIREAKLHAPVWRAIWDILRTKEQPPPDYIHNCSLHKGI